MRHPLIAGLISIHAPLAGCDTPRAGSRCSPRGISIHAPLAGCDQDTTFTVDNDQISIHAPLAGCDRAIRRSTSRARYFNPRTPCGVRLMLYADGTACDISIHAPLAGCDAALLMVSSALRLFQSTHPLRGATAKTYKENCTFFELADKLSARIAAKKPSAKADRCA